MCYCWSNRLFGNVNIISGTMSGGQYYYSDAPLSGHLIKHLYSLKLKYLCLRVCVCTCVCAAFSGNLLMGSVGKVRMATE